MVSGRRSSVLTIAPSNIREAEQALRVFDCSTQWGPSSSLTRFARLARRRAFPAAPTGWDWVDDILRRFPALGNLTAAVKYRGRADTVPAAPDRQLALLKVQQRQAFCLVEMAPSMPWWSLSLVRIQDTTQCDSGSVATPYSPTPYSCVLTLAQLPLQPLLSVLSL